MADERTEKQKVQEITDKLEEGLKELFESEKYKSYLSTMSKFHNYSFNNTLLIAMQKPEATLVAGYKAWQKNFERHVNKGEKAIRILAPAPYKIKEERDKIDPVTGEMTFDENGMPQKEEVEVTIPTFRAVSVFDVSQTDGKPIPELETQELLSTVEGYEDFVNAMMFVSPVPIGFEDILGDSKGYFHTGMRISEFCGLTLKDIDMKNRIIDINHQLQRTSWGEYVIEKTKTNAGTRKLPMTEDVYQMFQAIIEDRPTDLPEIMVQGYGGFLFRDKNGMPEVAMHWEHRFNHAVKRYNDIFKVQMPNITPHVCRHTYCSNMARARMNPKTLQYLMGHSDISVTMNVYTHLGFDDARMK